MRDVFGAWRGVVALLGLLALPSVTLANSRIELRPCAIKGVEAPAECGKLDVLEHRGASDGR